VGIFRRALITVTPLTSEARAMPVASASSEEATTPMRLLARSVFVVVLFWWMATGVIFALERGPGTRTVGLVLAAGLAVYGLLLMQRTRDDTSAAGARQAFLGAAFVWSFAQVLFYGGWFVGPAHLAVPVPAELPSLSLAVRAVTAMLWYQLAMLFALIAAWLMARTAANRMAWYALAVFWITHQLASVNIFLGVENPGRGFFPEPLTFLESYFGPTQNSWLLLVSIAVVLMFTLAMAVVAIRAGTSQQRQQRMLLTVLGGLGVVELAVLGSPQEPFLWEWFLALRGY
jgi:putative photosynthetic complex assembly protein 2